MTSLNPTPTQPMRAPAGTQAQHGTPSSPIPDRFEACVSCIWFIPFETIQETPRGGARIRLLSPVLLLRSPDSQAATHFARARIVESGPPSQTPTEPLRVPNPSAIHETSIACVHERYSRPGGSKRRCFAERRSDARFVSKKRYLQKRWV